MFIGVPKGLFDPVSCKNTIWVITKTANANGKIKCKEKNRVKVALSTENPPQIQKVSVFPTYGIADSKLVI
ncbi:hypothetical protein, partial [Herbaspirillum sp. ST 5-3]|uniref:hypothetical protein n=1 Tax=Herbaspirillum sp. ST 5-3 TaxID=2567936 RepID=UPI001FFED451